jgi:hypothetical protein
MKLNALLLISADAIKTKKAVQEGCVRYLSGNLVEAEW